jgi:predicted DNA-binding transcriptional regulator YafY
VPAKRRPKSSAHRALRGKRHGPGLRLMEIRAILSSGTGVSVYDLAERFGMSIRNAARYIDALRESGEQVSEKWSGKRKVFRLEARPKGVPDSVSFGTSAPTGVAGTEGERVRVWFSSRVAPVVQGHGWHPPARIRKVRDGIELSLEVRDATWLRGYVLSFGDEAELLEPASLRTELADAISRAARRYQKRLHS